MMDSNCLAVNIMKIFGEEIQLLITGACASKSNHSIQQGREAARTIHEKTLFLAEPCHGHHGRCEHCS